MSEHVKTLKLRIKDKHAAVLGVMASEVNTVWNFCNAESYRAVKEWRRIPAIGPVKKDQAKVERGRAAQAARREKLGLPQKQEKPAQDRFGWLSDSDLKSLTAGFSKCDGIKIGSQTIQQICEEYVTRRQQFKKDKLSWRVSNQKSSKRSLGWVPFKVGGVKYKGGQVTFCGIKLSLWDSYGLDKYELRAGSFNQDSRGRWYLNVAVKAEVVPSQGTAAVGIDLGLKYSATCSTGQAIEGRLYRKLEKSLGVAQRAGKKNRARAIHAKIMNQRKDMLHKFSTALVRDNAAVFVGNVPSKALVKTKMAKSTLDAGWSIFKTMLEYKCHQAGVVFDEVSEAYTTQTCSCCGSIPKSSPKGRVGLRMRHWTCSDCGAEHDRDINAAANILARGLTKLAISVTAEAGACETVASEAKAEAGHGLPAGGIFAR
jgi:IS605 OrfB family transposase